MMKSPLRIALLVLACALAPLQAALQVPHFFSDHMVLQRETEASLWGKAQPGAEVIVQFRGQKARTTAAADGHWKVKVLTGKADAKGSTLVIQSQGETREIQDVLVGEVWLASGQSNMVFTMNRVPAYTDLLKLSNHPGIRMFNAPTITTVEPQDDIQGNWQICTPESAPGFSAVAFFFARKLHQELGIPIGVIKSAWGGKPVETFTSREALNTLDGTRKLVEALFTEDAAYDEAKANAAHEARMAQWRKAVEELKKNPDPKKRLRRPEPPTRPLLNPRNPGVIYNAMIHPFIGYTIRGAIWYQGEGNAKVGAVPYDQTLPLMIRDWRTRWGSDFSFLFVQLANFRAPTTDPGVADPWPLLQDRMRKVLDQVPGTGMAIINDVGEEKDIHPKNKLDVGERLARWALVADYGRKMVQSGPLLASHSVKGKTLRVRFHHVGEGLRSRDGKPLARFEIAGADQKWQWADARIEGKDTVVLSHKGLGHPVAARYAWASNPAGANLVNSEGLPTSVFRTDDWDDVEAPSVAPAPKLSPDQARRLEIRNEIKKLQAERAKHEAGSKEYREISGKLRTLLEEFKKLPAAR